MVTTKEGDIFKFKECPSRLYYYDYNNYNKSAIKGFSALETVRNNEKGYNKSEIARAKKARRYQSLLGWPATGAFIGYLKRNLIENCDVSIQDIERAEEIYGTPRPILEGKMKRVSPVMHPKTMALQVPYEIL